MDSNSLLVCDQCDLLLQEVKLEPGVKAYCSRCDNDLYRNQPDGLRLSLIFSLTAAILFLISNAFPIVTIDSQGLSNSTTLLDAAFRLVEFGITPKAPRQNSTIKYWLMFKMWIVQINQV
jgi:paraquat-inducible protein A